jgi:hypothetical protein
MKTSRNALLFLFCAAQLSLAFTPAFKSKPLTSMTPAAKTDGERTHGLEITVITQWNFEGIADKAQLFRTAIFKDVHVAWDPYIQLRGYFDSKALGAGTTFGLREVQEAKMPYLSNWLVMWVAHGTVSPEGAIDVNLKLYDLPGSEHVEMLFAGMLLSSASESLPPETYKSISVHLEPYETYKAVPLGMGGALELFVSRSQLPPVSALVPDVDPTELELDIARNPLEWARISDIAEIQFEEWTGIEIPW